MARLHPGLWAWCEPGGRWVVVRLDVRLGLPLWSCHDATDGTEALASVAEQTGPNAKGWG